MKKSIILLLALASLSSCVSKKVFLDMQTSRDDARLASERLQADLNNCNQQAAELRNQVANLSQSLRNKENDLLVMETQLQNEKNKVHALEQQMEYFKSTNANLLDRLSDLSVVSKTGAESIKKSLEALNEQNKYIKDLTSSIQRKDSLNLILVMNLKRSLADINDEDVKVEVRKGVVLISISDRMLYKSGSAEISPAAEAVLGKIAKVINDYKEFDILVEGHTDSVPISNACMTDNWDLSTKRATSVVRLLQQKHGVAPERMTAGGRSEFIPKSTNATAEGRRLNRRTEIVILPQLDQFFQLLEAPAAQK